MADRPARPRPRHAHGHGPATGAEKVDLVLTPTGTETAPYAEVVATSAGHDGTFTLVWEYGDDVLHDHLSVIAEGPGGRAEVDLPNVHRD